MDKPFHIIPAKAPLVPIILSVPHSGTSFPEELLMHYKPEMAKSPDDTDWFVERVYNFASELGITIIHAKYSRWVIDLNRDPKSAPLYNDGRIITGLTSTTDFFGKEIYASADAIPDEKEISRRLETYYWPYYHKVAELLEERKKQFGKALLWDGHSIRAHVPTIRKDPFPDMILGNNEGKTAHPEIIQTALTALKKGPFEVSHNTPFKGGHITRYFGKPENNIHALQLEMNKILYMDDSETQWHEERASRVSNTLKPVFEALIEKITSL